MSRRNHHARAQMAHVLESLTPGRDYETREVYEIAQSMGVRVGYSTVSAWLVTQATKGKLHHPKKGVFALRFDPVGERAPQPILEPEPAPAPQQQVPRPGAQPVDFFPV